MSTRPTRVAQTSTEVKKLFKQNGPGLSERQQRQLERAADLEKRAQGIRERDERSKANKKKREEKERKEAALRQMNGVGRATQMIGYSRTQAQLKKGMEAFVGYRKKSEEDKKKKELEVAKQLEALVEEEVTKEPWDDDDTLDLPFLAIRAEDHFDDDLDDETLLELHDQVMSDPIEEITGAPKPPQVASSAPVIQSPKMVNPSEEDMSFVRLHGPINKMIDSILDKLPEPLIELLSQDCSTDPGFWDPSPGLLHKLNPSGLPPHRLRIKVGCVVILLRDLNSSSQLSKSQHLQILRIEQDRLECLVLDGQLEGTKTILTKVPFAAKHRNEEKFAYQRIQFPIQVSKDFVAPPIGRKITLSGFKRPTPCGQALQLSSSSSRRSMPTPRAMSQLNRNPSFKLPGLPASKAKPALPPKPTISSPTSLLDGWDDFLDTATQIARDLSSEPSSAYKAVREPLTTAKAPASVSNSLPPLSTQDFDFSLEDLEESPGSPKKGNQAPGPQPQKTIAVVPRTGNLIGAPSSLNKFMPANAATHSRTLTTSMKPPEKPPLKRNFSQFRDRTATSVSTSRDSGPTIKKPRIGPVQNMGRNCTNNVTTTKAASNLGAKVFDKGLQGNRLPSFSEFGLSTQEAVSFFDDDDDLAFGSPPIAV